MNATEARQLLLVRACETADPPVPGWSSADQAWASDEALRREGEDSPPERWLLRRAELAGQRMASRDPAFAAVSAAAGTSAGNALWMLPVALAVLIGLASNLVGPSQQINLLAPPLLAILVWNLVVYAALAIHAVASLRAVRADMAHATNKDPLSRALQWAMERPVIGAIQARTTPAARALRRYALDWAGTSQGLQTARIATVMHLAAAALAAGAVGGLYFRGLAFEFRAGWDSTFLGADAVHTWLELLLGPAAWLTRWSLPDASQIEALRFSQGPGENAAHWIHLYAITTAALVLLPRGWLALAAARRAGRLQRDFPLSLDEPYFQRLLRQTAHERAGSAQSVVVLPYSYQVAPERRAALATALAAEIGPRLQLSWLPSVPLGGEDDLGRHWPTAATGGPAPALVVPVLPLTATPERETHGAFLGAVQARCATLTPAPACRVVIDESGFRQRLSAADLTTRLDQRRAAWQAMLEPSGLRPLFLDLGPTAAGAPL